MLPVLMTACNVERYEPINVAVYPSTQSCAIKEQSMDCKQLANYLRDTLKAANDRDITVSFAGSENVSKDDKSIDRVAELIREAGYTNVKAYRFDLN